MAAAPTYTARMPMIAAGCGGCLGTPSAPNESRASDASICPAINRPTVTTAPILGNKRIVDAT
jgi:hypothetical protein